MNESLLQCNKFFYYFLHNLSPNLSTANSYQNSAAFGINASLKSKLELCNMGGFSSFLAELKKKNAPGLTLVKNAKSSLALKGSNPLPTFSFPKTFSPTLSTWPA